ncbi:MAG: universal stress protein [Deltaproteobacteria bacterium]|nr:universal stress protein [Deltaproteobacteria bacterium]
MEKKILVAVDGSQQAKAAVAYAVAMSSQVKPLTFTLFHGQPVVSGFLLDEAKKDKQAEAALKTLIRRNAEASEKLLARYKAQMVRMGVPERAIDVISRPRVFGLSKDILDCAQQGLYDAVVVGRRGLSRLQKTLMGSLTADLVGHCRDVPLWIVDGGVTSHTFLVAVDGSEASLRAIDHVSFMLGGNPDVTMTLFHVIPRVGDYCVVDFGHQVKAADTVLARGDRRCIDNFYGMARHIMKERELQEDQVEIKVVKRTVNPGKAIMSEAKKGDYGTVVIGRRGQGRSFFMGSISRYVLDKTVGRAVWLVS